MKVGCQMAFNETTSPQYISEAGALVEELGFHSFWVPEHVLFFPEYESRYPYSENGKIRGDPRSLLDPLTALTFVAAFTSTIRLCTGICLVPQRNPVYTAKQVADLDYLSGGRVEFGIGIGWLKEEFEALGIPWADRAGRTRECIEVMQTLWCDELSSYEGQYFNIKDAYQNPKPVQKPHPPLIFGGESNAALRRVATQGQGWYGFNLTPASFEQNLKTLESLMVAENRSLADLSIYISPAAGSLSADDIRTFSELGADQVIFPVFARDSPKLRVRALQTLELANV
ncbi:MAG: LLM class F420-dependent oxidoreductase [bacterium]|nr:LLM class F420-dependent oxidoreductase [Gammaproteobacteria bacterium]HIL99322.1 LLM class F420-dependent oxidoreductase [Pseudomonadales bacterium]